MSFDKMLRNNNYKWMYRSFDSDFEKDFFNPSYTQSIHLDRAAGYFSLNSLILSIEGLIEFINNGGDIFLICNPDLSAEDIALIDAGTALSSKELSSSLIKSIEIENDSMRNNTNALDVVCNMIADNRLKIKVAFKKHGIYHEKFGIFYDKNDDRVYFNGSVNQTRAAIVDNFESFQVTPSWRDEVANVIVNEESLYFKRIWNNELEALNVIDFPEAVRNHLFDKYKRSESLQAAIDKYTGQSSIVSEDIPQYGKKQLYPYQEQAINEFVANGYCHFYEMATGTGKTFTAVKTIERLGKELDRTPFTMVLVPQIDLQVQWERSLKEEGFTKVFLMGGVGNDAIDEFNKATIEYYNDETVVCVAVYDTFFNKIYSDVDELEDVFIIVDEAHNISSKQYPKLPQNARCKLGLSATIQRFDAHETERILYYFIEGQRKPFYYGIEDAIENGFLSRYVYYPLYVNLTVDEFDSYQRYTKSIALEMNKPLDEQDAEKLTTYRRDRSRIVKQATLKIDKLEEMANGDYDFRNSVVYCGQGKDLEAEEDISIIDTATKIIGNINLRVSQFTSKTQNRKLVLEQFESGYYHTLVAIKCFDEGVDVPKLDKIYIMASEGSMRQTVQRRGRVLRKCKETGKTIAKIYDMIALPPEGVATYEMGASSLIKNEMRRAYEYNRLAENHHDNIGQFESLLDKYNLTEEDLNDDRATD